MQKLSHDKGKGMFPHLKNNPIFYNEILNVGKKKKIGNTTVDLALKLSDFTNGFEDELTLERIEQHFEKISKLPFDFNKGRAKDT